MDAELLRAMMLDQETFTFAVIHYCVLLYDKSNAISIHKKALSGDEKAILLMQKVERFNDARFRLVQNLKNLDSVKCGFETLISCDQVEEYELSNNKVLLICSKRREGTRCLIVTSDIGKLYNAIFFVQNFDRIIKESFLGFIKKDKKNTAILGPMCWSMWELFSRKVSILLDHSLLNVKRGEES